MAWSSWLQSRDLEVPESMEDAASMDMSGGDHGDTVATAPAAHDGDARHAHRAGDGASSPRARGREFDRLFLAGMIRHHEGAVAMARDEMEAGSDTLALELAADVAAGQQAEIGRMVDIRDRSEPGRRLSSSRRSPASPMSIWSKSHAMPS